MFRRPDDDDDDFSGRKVVKAKPIAEKYAKKLGTEFSTGKTFVTGSSKSQNEFYGSQQVKSDEGSSSSSSASKSGSTQLTEDEKNKLSAKILKAEMKGDTELVKKLKRKLESGVSGDDEPPKSKSKDVVMMRRDREGNILPASSRKSDSHRHGEGSSRMRKEYEKSQDLDSMIREEKTGTAGDQLRLFEGSLISFVMHQLGSSLHMISRYVLSNNLFTSCDCIVHSLLTNRKIELRTNVVEALWRIGDDPNGVPFIAGGDFSWSSSRFFLAVVEGVVQIRADGAAPNPKRPNPKWYESALRPNPKPPEFEVVRMRGAQIRNARVRSGMNPKWYGSEAPKLETPESEVRCHR
uniref:Uncharacterized protein n=1 Tax=Caenorhabditis japonica TaxID=281687 RepID=A0A8R1DRS8_CAEJA